MIVVVLLAESTVRRPPIETDPLIFPNMFPVTVKSLGMVTVVPDVGWIVFTLNVLICYFFNLFSYIITNLAPTSTIIELELNTGPVNIALYPEWIVKAKD